jgi:hypothetical protein
MWRVTYLCRMPVRTLALRAHWSSHRFRALVRAVALIYCVLVVVQAPAALASTNPNWTMGVKALLPADAAPNPGPQLNSVSCAAAGNCTAVGSYQDSLGHSQGLLLSQSSNAWSVGTKAPLPGDAAAAPISSVNSVSCVSAGNCTAVGSYHDSSGYSQGLLLIDSSGVWTAIKAPLPAGAGTNPAVSLSWATCTSAGNCTAVGSYQDSSAHSQGLLLSESSGSWTAAEMIPPGDAGTNPQVGLGSVSCPAAGDCVAIGSYRNSLTQNQVLLVSETSGTWSAAFQPPLPADGGTSGGHGLRSVSCPSVGNCAVTGYYYDSAGHTQGLLLSESSGTWTPTKASLPADANAIPSAEVSSVSCASAGECAAGGDYTDASGHSQGLLLSESSNLWSAGMKAPLPADAGPNPSAFIDSVSCVSAGNCSAVGSYQDSSGHTQGLVLSESSGSWSTVIKAAVPSDAGTNPNAELNSVSCASAGSCSTIGNYQDSSSNYQGLLISAEPANPTLTLSAPTSRTVGSTLDSSTLTAVLSAGASPAGTITFRVFGPQASAPSSCASGGTIVGSASVSGNGAYHPAAGFNPTSAGRYWWYASYGGDTGDNTTSSPCGASMPETIVAGPVLSGLRVSPHTVSLAGRKVKGKCVKPTHKNTGNAHCRRAIKLKIGYTLDVGATVTITLKLKALGRKVNHHCVKQTAKNRVRPKCTRVVNLRGKIVQRGKAGANRFAFNGTIGGHKLSPGTYQLIATPADGGARTVTFKIVP